MLRKYDDMLGRFDTIPESDRQTERQNCYVNIAHQCVNFAHIFPRTAMYSAAHSAMTVRLCLSYFVYYMKRAKKNIPKLYYMLMAYIFLHTKYYGEIPTVSLYDGEQVMTAGGI